MVSAARFLPVHLIWSKLAGGRQGRPLPSPCPPPPPSPSPLLPKLPAEEIDFGGLRARAAGGGMSTSVYGAIVFKFLVTVGAAAGFLC